MPWVPIEESSIPFSYYDYSENTMMADSIVSRIASTDGTDWEIDNRSGKGFMFRVTVLEYANGRSNASFAWIDEDGSYYYRGNEDSSGNTFSPSSFYGVVGPGEPLFYYSDPQEVRQEQYSFLIEVWDGPELMANDDEDSTPVGTPVTVDVLANDTLFDEPVTLEGLAGPPTIVTQPPVGTATVNADGTITYTPPEGFTGEVEFQYMIESEPEICAHIVFSDNWGDGSQTFYDDDFTDKPSWFDYGEQFQIDFGLGDTATYEWVGYFNMVSDSQVIYCGDGDGVLSQGENSICLRWLVEGVCPE